MFVCLLGSPLILIDQRPVEKLRRKNRALIFYLAAHPEPVTRDQVLALFWPDDERPSAQQTLRTMLHDLRKNLSEAFLRVEEDRLSLAPEVVVDARVLNAALAAIPPDEHRLAAALQAYRGDFLDGFTLPDAPEFDDWVLAEREFYNSQAIRAFSRLAQAQESGGQIRTAIDTLARALAIDPLREDLQRVMLRLRYRTGDRASAIRQYEALCKLLDQDLGVPPMPETRAIYDAILNETLPGDQPEPARKERRTEPAAMAAATPASAAAPSPGPAPLLPFTGRASELKTLDVLRSAGKLLLVEGAPGIGKTRLVNEFLAGAGQEVLVLRGVAHELEQGLPYQPVIDALRGLLAHPRWPGLRSRLDLSQVWLAEISRLVPELRAQFMDLPPVVQELEESRLWEGIHQFLRGLAALCPVALFLDDLHWADISTLGLAGYLARRAAFPATLIIATSRPVDAHSRLAVLVKSLAYEDHLHRVTLAPLSEADTRSVAARLSPAFHDPLSQWLAGSAEGNPFFITELVRYAYQANLLQKDGAFDPAALTSTHLLPPTVQNLILSRLIRLSEEARRVLDVAAVIGREFDFALVDRVQSLVRIDLSEAALLNALDELQAAVLIQPRGGDRFAFDHSLTMNVVLQDMGEARGRMLHRHAAAALEQIHAQRIEPNAGVIAYHYAKSSAPEKAGRYAFIAGQYAAGLAAWVEAIDFYDQALRVEADPGQRAAILTALGTARFHKGDFPQASAAFRSAIELAQPRRDLEGLEAAYMGLNLSLLPQSRFAEAIALGRELAQSGPPELAICAHFIWASGLSVESAHPDEAEAHLRAVEQMLTGQPEQAGYSGHVTLAHVKYQLAGVVGQQGKSAQAVALYREALELVNANETTLDLLRHIMLYNDLAYHLLLLGDPSAVEYAQAGIQLAKERGSLTHMPYLLSTSGEIALSANRLDEAEAFFNEGLQMAEQVPIVERIAGLTANLGLVARQRGMEALARERLSQALELADRLGAQHLAVRIRCWLAPLLPPEAARTCLEEARAIAQESGFQQLFEEIAEIEQAIE